MKNKFLDNELWMLSIGGAFQRASVYNEGASEAQRKVARQALRVKVQELAQQYYKPISEEEHIANIIDLIESTKADVFIGGKLKFGSAQKLFNLFLKYQWCRDVIPEPPHCPVDRIVLSRISKYNPECWTKVEDSSEYLRLIGLLREKASAESKSLAYWELEVFNRRSN